MPAFAQRVDDLPDRRAERRVLRFELHGKLVQPLGDGALVRPR